MYHNYMVNNNNSLYDIINKKIDIYNP